MAATIPRFSRPRTVLVNAFILAVVIVLVGHPTTPSAQQGGIILNGTITEPPATDPVGPPGLVRHGIFLFEPEVPLSSLKTVPIWNELERLLDNPYQVALCSSLGFADPLVQNTPGTTQITGSPVTPIYPAYCSNFASDPVNGVRGRPQFGVTLPPLLVHPLNYNPTDGEEMRLLNPLFTGAPWIVPDSLNQDANNPNVWTWSYRPYAVTPGLRRVTETAIDYNAPIKPDIEACLTQVEAWPPEGTIICGGDPGEPGYAGFGVQSILPRMYSTAAVPTSFNPNSPGDPSTPLPATAQLFDPTRGFIAPRTGAIGGLNKPSLRIAPFSGTGVPNYLVNVNPDDVAPSNENDYVRDRVVATALGKALFWDMQVGSDGVQACGSCHAHAGADNRTKNQLNPNHIGGDLRFEVEPPNGELVITDFPFNKYRDPDIAGDPACTPAITATINRGVLENNFPNGTTATVCDARNVIPDKNNRNGEPGFAANDVASSMGVHFGRFLDIPVIGSFGPPSLVGGVRSILPDLRAPIDIATGTDPNVDPIPGFQGTDGTGHGIRRVEPRNTPTIFAAALNFDNFWDGRARHDFNGGSVFGASDPQTHVFVSACPTTTACGGVLTPTRQIIRFVSVASLATGPALSEFEMSFLGRNWAKIGKKLLQAGVTPLANQLVSPTDSVLGPYSNQPGNPSPSPLCTAAALAARAPGKPGLCASYNSLIQAAFYPALHNNTTQHLNGCYTDGATFHPNQCGTERTTPAAAIRVLDPDGVVRSHNNDPFDGYVLAPANGAATATNTNQFTQMEGNFSLFFGLSLHTWITILMPDNTPYDQFLDRNPDMFEGIGEVGEPGLVGPLPLCTTATQRHCFREVGNFKRDSSFADRNVNDCIFPASGEGVTTLVSVAPCKGTRNPRSNTPDPLLGMDIFQGSNISLKNPNFRAARCGECHAGPTLTDNTTPFTFKAQLGDFIGEFLSPGSEALIEPLGRPRVISGFLLESEFNENGQDAIERRLINQSIVPSMAGLVPGLAFPDGLFTADHLGAGQSLFDNGVYNLGVTRCQADQVQVTGVCDDNGRGNVDAFGWPMSLAALLLKDLAGTAQQPGVPLQTFNPSADPECAPDCGGGGLFEESAQDQTLNPGIEDEPVNPLLPAYLSPFGNRISVGDTQPELDEVHAGINTLTDVAILEGFVDILGPFNPAGVLNESMNMGEGPEMGTWPIVNRVGRFGSIKAPQLREVELTGPYFHSGATLTLRQVVDFYVRGGNYPVTNAMHRDFNIVNLNLEVQSNLSEAEKVALVDFLLELTDDRVKFERGPFDHPEVILPLDGTAPENGAFTVATSTTPVALRDAALTNCVPSALGPGQQACMTAADGFTKLFLDVPAVGTTGNTAPLPNFLGISSGPRLSGTGANCAAPNNHYCR